MVPNSPAPLILVGKGKSWVVESEEGGKGEGKGRFMTPRAILRANYCPKDLDQFRILEGIQTVIPGAPSSPVAGSQPLSPNTASGRISGSSLSS